MNESEEKLHKVVYKKWQTIQTSTVVAPGVFLQDLEIMNSYVDQGLRNMIWKLQAKVLGEERPPKSVTESQIVEFKFPASPFQHWKDNHSDSWWLRWFVNWKPVIKFTAMKECRLTAFWDMADVYPEQSNIVPELGQPYVVINTARTTWTENDIFKPEDHDE